MNRSNIAMDGITMMDPQAHFEWYARALLTLSRDFLRQLPPQYEVEVDTETFLSSLSFVKDGTRRTAGPWDMAPSAVVHEVATTEPRGEYSNYQTNKCLSNNPDPSEMSRRELACHSFKHGVYPSVAVGIPTAPNEWPADSLTVGRVRSRSRNSTFYAIISNGLRIHRY